MYCRAQEVGMRIVIVIFMMFTALSTWAGTWLDNFDDGDFAGWQMDECLWHLSKYGCRFRKDEFCPKKRECPVGKFCVRGLVHVSAKGININTG